MKFLIHRTKVLFTNYSPFESTASFLVTALVFLLPLFFIPGLALPLQFTKSILVALIVFLGLIFYITSQLKKRQIDIPYNSVLLSLWLIPIAYFVSTVFSGNVKASMFGDSLNVDTFSFIVLMSLATFLVVALVKSQSRIVQIYFALFVSFGVLALFHILRLVFGADFLSFSVFSTNTSTPIGGWNDLGIFSGLIAILSLIMLTGHTLSKRISFAFKGALLVSLFFLVLINFSTVWWVVGFFALATFVYSVISGNDTEGGISFTSLLVLAIAIIILFFGSGGYLANQFNTSFIDVRPSWESTVDIGKVVYSDNPIFGSGPNTFDKQWLLNKPTEINETVFWNIDFNRGIGFIPTSFITTGLIGVIAWTIFFLMLLFSGFRSLILRPVEDRFSYHIILSSFLSALYLWILVGVSSPSASIIGLAFIFTGIFIASLRHQNKQLSISLSENPRLGFVAVLLLTIVFLGSVAGLFILSQKYISAISHQRGIALAQINLDEALQKINKATSLDENDLYFRSAAEANIAKLNQLFSEPNATDETRNQFQTALSNAIGNAQSAINIDSSNYLNWVMLARIYHLISPLNIEGAYENAVRSYDEALLYNPESPFIYLRRAELEFLMGNNESGKEFVESALLKKSNYTEAVFLLSQIQISEGNIKEAILSAEAITVINPTNSTAFFQLGVLRYNNNDNLEAISALERAVLINSVYSNARYFLGLSYYKENRVDDAIEQFVEIQKLNQDNVEIVTILENLRSGKAPIDDVVKNLPLAQ